jgi:cytosine/adenosine deaminase-related metal-dependent hydrolase
MDHTASALIGGTVVELSPPRCEPKDVVFADGRITQVGGEIPPGVNRIDAAGCVVMPAFAVAHTHLYSALACGMPPPAVPPTRFIEILQRVWWRLDRALDLDLVHLSALVGAVEAARRGVTFVVDHHASPDAVDGSLDRIADALDEVGIRGALCYETTDRGGPDKKKAGLRENERYLSLVRAGQRKHSALVGAHAPFTLEDETLDALCDLCRRFDVGIHVHVAEDTTDGLDAQKRGTTLVARLDRMGALRPGSIIAHGVHLDAGSVSRVMDAGAWIVTNARSNMSNAVGLSAARGPRIALGTDGIGADMIAEAQAHFFRRRGQGRACRGIGGEARPSHTGRVSRLRGRREVSASRRGRARRLRCAGIRPQDTDDRGESRQPRALRLVVGAGARHHRRRPFRDAQPGTDHRRRERDRRASAGGGRAPLGEDGGVAFSVTFRTLTSRRDSSLPASPCTSPGPRRGRHSRRRSRRQAARRRRSSTQVARERRSSRRRGR